MLKLKTRFICVFTTLASSTIDLLGGQRLEDMKWRMLGVSEGFDECVENVCPKVRKEYGTQYDGVIYAKMGMHLPEISKIFFSKTSLKYNYENHFMYLLSYAN